MASTSECPYCGATVQSNERKCPACGAVNEGYIVEGKKTIFLPKTIKELKEYCAQHGMPLQKMRFFIGENYLQPRAFGIYKDGDFYVVYKNKSNGERAIRYLGEDEEYAVNELFVKLMDECHKRGIYPDGKLPERENNDQGKSNKLQKYKIPIAIILVTITLTLSALIYGIIAHRQDGYYRFNDDATYYRYGTKWYVSEYNYDWHQTETIPVNDPEDYYKGTEFDSDWGETGFKDSSVWRKIQESHSSGSSDYDSWDSGDTDWDSDW